MIYVNINQINIIMSERIQTFNPDWEFAWIQDKKEFYINQDRELEENWNISLAAWSASCFLVNKEWKVYIVRRWVTQDSSGLYDKTVSWHMREWESNAETMKRELFEEVWVNAEVAKNEEEYRELKNKTDLTKKAILKIIDIDPWYLVSVKKWDKIIEKAFNVSLFVWEYDWDLEFIDWEADEYRLLTLDEIISLVAEQKENFKITWSLLHLINKYWSKINSIIKS